MGGVAHDVRRPRARHRLVAAEQVLDRRGGDDRPGPQGVGGDPIRFDSAAKPSAASVIAVLGEHVADALPIHFFDRFRGGESVRMCAWSEARSCEIAARVRRKVPRTSICCIRSNFLAGSSIEGERSIAEALLTTMSIAPNFSTVFETACSIESSWRTSPTIASARPPAAVISAAAVWTVPSRRGCGSLSSPAARHWRRHVLPAPRSPGRCRGCRRTSDRPAGEGCVV